MAAMPVLHGRLKPSPPHLTVQVRLALLSANYSNPVSLNPSHCSRHTLVIYSVLESEIKTWI